MSSSARHRHAAAACGMSPASHAQLRHSRQYPLARWHQPHPPKAGDSTDCLGDLVRVTSADVARAGARHREGGALLGPGVRGRAAAAPPTAAACSAGGEHDGGERTRPFRSAAFLSHTIRARSPECTSRGERRIGERRIILQPLRPVAALDYPSLCARFSCFLSPVAFILKSH